MREVIFRPECRFKYEERRAFSKKDPKEDMSPKESITIHTVPATGYRCKIRDRTKKGLKCDNRGGGKICKRAIKEIKWLKHLEGREKRRAAA